MVADSARLGRENERLRMERDIPKEAALIFGAASR
jgi:transposase